MEFLCSFLRHHLAGKPVVALPNVSCFLRLINCEKLILHFFHTTILFLIICTMRSLYWSFLNLPCLLILELIIMLFFCQVYYAKFPPGMEQRRVLLMYPLLSKLWLNLHYIIIFFISIHFHELYQGSPTGFLGSRIWPF